MSSPAQEPIQPPVSSPSTKPGKPPFIPPEHGLAHHAWLVEIGAALLVVLILLITESGGLFRDSGSLWHPVVGELILEKEWITKDPFSHTKKDQLWIPFQWLAEVGMAKLYAWAQFDGLFWGTVALFAGMFGWLAGRAVRCGCHPVLALLIIALTFFECCHHFHARPHLFTMAGMCILFAVLSDIESGRMRLVHILWLLPVFVLWTNLHGGVLGGWGTLGFAFLGWGLWWLLDWSSPIQSWKTVGLLILFSAAATATFLVNPYGWDLILMWQRVMQADLPKIINEHAPLNLTSAVGIVVLGEALLYLLILGGIWPRIPRVTWLLPLVWLLLGISRVRHAPLFSIVAMIAMIDMLPYTFWMRWMSKRSDLYIHPKPDDQPEPKWGILGARLFPLLILFVPLVAGLRFVKLDDKRWPLELVPQLQQLAQQPGTVLFNEDLMAGMVIRYVPGMKVFIDDRCELYGEAFLLDYVDALRDNPQKWIQTWEVQYGINVALTYPKSKFTAYLREAPNWKLVQETEAGCLFVRKLFALENSFIYFPQVARDFWQPPVDFQAEDVYLTTSLGDKIHAWWCPQSDAKWTVLFSHGNAGNLSGHARIIPAMRTHLKANVLIYDYPGYGKSSGKPSEKSCHAAALTAYDWLIQTKNIRSDLIILMGQSLGGAMACELAVNKPHLALVLLSTFTSIRDRCEELMGVHVRQLMSHHYDNQVKLKTYFQPILIGHGDQDEVIPVHHGERLFAAAASQQKVFHPIPGGRHNELYSHFFYRMSQFLDSLN